MKKGKVTKYLAGFLSLMLVLGALSGNISFASDVDETETTVESMNLEEPEGNPEGIPEVPSEEGAGEEASIEETPLEEAPIEEAPALFEARGVPGTIATVDSISKNIALNMFDYSTGITEDVSGGSDEGINYKRSLKFSKKADSHTQGYNKYTGSSAVYSGIVHRLLNIHGFPRLAVGSQTDLDYLFDSSQTDSKVIYPNLNHLFYQDANDYYIYDSATNYAQLNGSDFIVYNQGLDGFFPFNTYSDYEQYGDGGMNHYFGLTMSANFIQPKNGQINGRDMTFEFSGDDDVWVFIDNQLVLDIGGIHGAASGSINFRTGTVKVNGANQTNMFRILGNFDNYSSHSIRFFYLERGNDKSNCKLKFNLATIPSGSVMVTKEVTETANDAIDYSNIDFTYQIFKEGNILADTGYQIYANGEKIGDGITDANGFFALKDGQSAIFGDFLATEHYEVREIGSIVPGYTVSVNGTEKEIIIPEEQDALPYASSDVLEAGDYPSITFQNAVTNGAVLKITKNLAPGSEGLADKTFTMQVTIGGNLYSGTYQVGESENLQAVDGLISLRSGQTAIISGLPYGAGFSVEEVGLDGSYSPTYAMEGFGFDLTIPNEENGQTAVSGRACSDITVTVENTAIKIESGKTSVKVKKNWKDMEVYENLLPAYLEVTLYEDVNRNGVKDEEDVLASGTGVNPTIQLSKSNGWEYTWNNLKEDTDYVVEEVLPDGFLLESITYDNTFTSMEYVDRMTSCSEKIYALGKNNVLLVKPTGGGDFFLWSVYDLKLSQEELEGIRVTLNKMGLPGVGNLKGLTYQSGLTDTSGITLTPGEHGWTLTFAKTSVWSQFWTLRYDRLETAVLTNKFDETSRGSLIITKKINDVDYDDGDPIFTFRITDRLGNVLYRTVRFSEGDAFRKTIRIDNLPVGKCIVEELKTMRYTCTDSMVKETLITFANPGKADYTNKLTYDKNFSHTDVVENDFTIGADGTVTCEKNFLRGEEAEVR